MFWPLSGSEIQEGIPLRNHQSWVKRRQSGQPRVASTGRLYSCCGAVVVQMFTKALHIRYLSSYSCHWPLRSPLSPRSGVGSRAPHSGT
ncbi:unnamed protein product [Lota lota]